MITASIDTTHYLTTVHSESHTLFADEPAENGGQNKGFAPRQLLAASLAACTAITLRMYCDRKGWQVENIQVNISFKNTSEDLSTGIIRNIILPESVTPEQRERLMDIANKCPVHKILSNPIRIETQTQ